MLADVGLATCYVHTEDAEIHLLRAIRAAGANGNDIAVSECACANAALAHLGRDGDYSPLPEWAIEMAADWMREAHLQDAEYPAKRGSATRSRGGG